MFVSTFQAVDAFCSIHKENQLAENERAMHHILIHFVNAMLCNVIAE